MHLEQRHPRITHENRHRVSAEAPNEAGLILSPEELRRVALVAAETASRFAGADTAASAMEWMNAPRRLFGGMSAIHACIDELHCRRAVTLHGLGMDPEADDVDVDLVMALVEDRDETDAPSCGSRIIEEYVAQSPKLFVSEISHEDGETGVWAFGAMVAQDESEVRRLLEARYGADVAAGSRVRAGFDRDEGMARTLVSPSLAETLAAVAQDPRSPLARGLDLVIEQRFRA